MNHRLLGRLIVGLGGGLGGGLGAWAIAACGGPQSSGNLAPRDHQLALYRDRALVREVIEVDVGGSRRATAKIAIPRDLTPQDIVVLDRGKLTSVRLALPVAAATTDPAVDRELEEPAKPANPLGPLGAAEPAILTVEVEAPRPGSFAIELGYATRAIGWDASYTMTTTPARAHVVLRGAIAVRNRTGVGFPGTTIRVFDAEIGSTDLRTALRAAHAASRELGRIDLRPGETRIELVDREPPRSLRSVLVYDPVGSSLDRPKPEPARDRDLGAHPGSHRVTESFEVVRPRHGAGLPRGKVRLLEQRPDASLGLLAQTILFDTSTQIAEVDTISLGPAEAITATRERTELTIDESRRRIVEEFVLTIDNARAVPVEVVLREHLYRGQKWTLAFQSVDNLTREGPQQIVMRTQVAAKAKAKVLYVVVYTW